MNTGAGTMTKKRGDDQYGYDPERAAARLLRERLERQAEQRPDKPAQKLGDVLKLPKVTPTTKRLIDAHAEIIDGPADDIAFLHTVLCQTGLPYRPTDKRVWIRDQGTASLLIEAGHARHPDTGKWVELGLPHGERPRLILIYLSTEAVRTGSPTIEVGGSLTAFARSLGIDTNGPSIRRFKDQLARLAASTVRLGVVADGRATQINTQIVSGIDLWMPKDANQRVLWPSTVTLSADYFASLQRACRSARSARHCGPGRFGSGAGRLRLACPAPAPDRPRQAADDHLAGAEGSVWGGLCRTAHLGVHPAPLRKYTLTTPFSDRFRSVSGLFSP